MAVVMSFGMTIAQPPTQGGNQGGNQGPPPCDEWLNSDMAHDMNGDGTVDENDCPQQGPDPFQQAFMTTMQNGGTPDVAFEAVAAVFHQMEVECPDCEMSEEEFQEGKAEAKAAFDAVLADGGTPEEAFHAAMETHNEGGDQGPPTCDVCGYTFTGEGDHHGHCDKCDFVFTSDNDQHGHCDQCDYIFDGEGDRHGHCDKCDHIYSGDDDRHGHCDKCDHIYSGGDDDRHGHCRVCDAEMNTDEDWRGHCDANPDHCRPQAGDTCGYGHDGDEACDYVFTGDEGEDHHHCDHCGLAVNSGEEMHNHLEADHPNRPARDNCEALDRGLDSFINENGDAIAVWATNGDGSPACGHDDGNN